MDKKQRYTKGLSCLLEGYKNYCNLKLLDYFLTVTAVKQTNGRVKKNVLAPSAFRFASVS